MKILAGILPLAAALGIATASWAAKPITDADLATLKMGETTYDQVVAQFGKPMQVERSSDGTRTLTYTLMKTHTKLATFVPVVGLFAGGAKGSIITDRFTFGADGKLKNVWASDAEVECSLLGHCGSVAPTDGPAALPTPVSAASAVVAKAEPPPAMPAPVAPAVASPTPVATQVSTVAPKPPAARPRSSCIRVVSDPSQSTC